MLRELFCLGLGLLLIFGLPAEGLPLSEGRESNSRSGENGGSAKSGRGDSGYVTSDGGSQSNERSHTAEGLGGVLKKGFKDSVESIERGVSDVIDKFKNGGNRGSERSGRQIERLITSESSGSADKTGGKEDHNTRGSYRTNNKNGNEKNGNSDISGGIDTGISRGSGTSFHKKDKSSQGYENGSEGSHAHMSLGGNSDGNTGTAAYNGGNNKGNDNIKSDGVAINNNNSGYGTGHGTGKENDNSNGSDHNIGKVVNGSGHRETSSGEYNKEGGYGNNSGKQQ